MTLSLPPSVPRDVPLLVAYSGGADSGLLLYLAKAYGDTHRVPVYAAHLHHGIRGEEADRDLDFCRKTAARLDVTLFEKFVDVPALSRQSGRSPEQEAREQRYLFFREIMETHEIPLLLTAHHADDQLETLLLRLLRGSGTRGMSGIPQVRPLSYGQAVRPLLFMTKAEILDACQVYGLDYVTDSTNALPFTLRNRIRQEIIPSLEDMVGQGVPQEAAGRLAHTAGEDAEYLSMVSEQALTQCLTEDGLCIAALNRHHPAIAKRVLALAYHQATVRLLGTSPDPRHTLTTLHLESLLSLCHREESGSSLDLPLLTACIHKGSLTFRPSEVPPPPSSIPLCEGDNFWDGGHMIIRIASTHTPPADGEALIAEACFPVDKLPLPLWARPREAGDIIHSHGMHKKLKKLLCDKGIPLHLRDRLPLICYGEEKIPLWYPTVAFADGFLPPDTGKAWHISIINKEKS